MEKIRVRGRNYISVVIIALIFTISLMTAIRPAKAAYVKVYVDQPGGYLPFVAIDSKFNITVKIDTNGIVDGSANSIVAWGLDFRIDPAVIDIDTVPGPGFPPPPPAAQVFGALDGMFLKEFADFYPDVTANLLAGTSNPTTGYWDDITESLLPWDYGGAGDYVCHTLGADTLIIIEVTSKSDTQPCLLDLIDAEYVTPDGSVHPVEIVLDGYYGTPPPRHLSATAPFDPLTPIGSTWHELYPNYCNYLTLTSWEDNGDGYLSASDQIDMTNETDGWIYWFHVDAVTVTIHWTFKPPDEGVGSAEPFQTVEDPELLPPPIDTCWHQIYPDYCREFNITSWEDNDVSGTFNPSDQFDFEYVDEPGVTHWAHLDAVTTDIILSFKEKQPPVPEFPLGAAVEVGLIVAVAYIWWTRRRRLREVP